MTKPPLPSVVLYDVARTRVTGRSVVIYEHMALFSDRSNAERYIADRTMGQWLIIERTLDEAPAQSPLESLDGVTFIPTRRT